MACYARARAAAMADATCSVAAHAPATLASMAPTALTRSRPRVLQLALGTVSAKIMVCAIANLATPAPAATASSRRVHRPARGTGSAAPAGVAGASQAMAERRATSWRPYPRVHTIAAATAGAMAISAPAARSYSTCSAATRATVWCCRWGASMAVPGVARACRRRVDLTRRGTAAAAMALRAPHVRSPGPAPPAATGAANASMAAASADGGGRARRARHPHVSTAAQGMAAA